MPKIKGVGYYRVYLRKGNSKYKFLEKVSNNHKFKLYIKKSKKTDFYFRFKPYTKNGTKIENLFAGYTGSSKYSLHIYR